MRQNEKPVCSASAACSTRSLGAWSSDESANPSSGMAAAFPRSHAGNHRCVDPADAAELKATLVGVSLPAEKPQLLEYAVRQRTEPRLLEQLRSEERRVGKG